MLSQAFNIKQNVVFDITKLKICKKNVTSAFTISENHLRLF